MKKFINGVFLYDCFPKISLKMKLTSLFFMMFLFHMNANDVLSQNKKVSLSMIEVTVESVLNEIERKTDFKFLYEQSVFQTDKIVSISVKREKLSHILETLFKHSNVSILFLEKQVHIKTGTRSLNEGKTIGKNLAQQKEISGIITDENGDPLPGANIIEKGTTNGTQTDFDGEFSIEVADSNAVLIISYLGYTTKEVVVDGKIQINIQMQPDSSGLDEVVVVGYTSQVKGELTGAVSSVDISEALKTPVTNAAEALQGRTTGVTVINNGRPGSSPKVVIRGFGTSNNTNPLYIIDGVQTLDANVLTSINPNDIDQMNVLKDAAAAIYGARASNGVVIITTKSGGYNMDKAKMDINFYTGFGKATNIPEMMNAQQHGNYVFSALSNVGATVTHPQYGSGSSAVVPNQLIGVSRIVSYNPVVKEPVSATVTPGGTNWIDAITRNAVVRNMSLALQNGTKSGKYYMSINYLDQEGLYINTGFKQVGVVLNSEFKLNEYITIGEHMNLSYSKTQANEGGSIINVAQRTNPLIPVYDDNGNFGGNYSNSAGLGNTNSPFAMLSRQKDDYGKIMRVLGDVYLSARLYDGLTFKTNLGGTLESGDNRYFSALDPENSEPSTINTLNVWDNSRYSWVWSNTLNYKKSFGDHKIDVLAGVESVKNWSAFKRVSRSDFLFENKDYYTLNSGSGAFDLTSVGESSSSLFSVFGNINYSYKGKYLATITVRRDKSSRFSGDNQYGTFPSASAGWYVSKEDFFPSEGLVNSLKIRASYGELGNQTLPLANPTRNISVLSESLADYSFDGSSITAGAYLQNIGNPDLEWETSITKNLGFDFGFFDSKLGLTLDVFEITTDKLVVQNTGEFGTTAPDATPPLFNLGSIENTGFEITLGYNNETDSGWSYGANLNLSSYKNEFTKMSGAFMPGSRFRNGTLTRSEVGQPISSFYGRVVEGVFNSEAEVSAAADQGFSIPAAGVGRLRYKDVDNNGLIDDNDRDYIGSPHADFTYGLSLNSAYKGFDISLFLIGSQGNDLINYERLFSDFPTFFNTNRSTRLLNAWTPENHSDIPAVGPSIVNSEDSPSSYYVEDGSYLRLKNLQIGYTFANTISDKIGIESFRLYIQGTNLFTITGYEGMDPEVSSGSNLNIGIDSGNYPSSQIFTIGANIKL